MLIKQSMNVAVGLLLHNCRSFIILLSVINWWKLMPTIFKLWGEHSLKLRLRQRMSTPPSLLCLWQCRKLWANILLSSVQIDQIICADNGMIRGNGITPSITITILMRNINAANYLSDCFPSLSFLPKIQTNAVKLRKKRRN